MNRPLWAVLAALAFSGAAQAVQLSADAGEVKDIRWATGNTLYAASQGGGVFKSLDSGASWARTGLATGYAWQLAVSPLSAARVYAATDAGLFMTANSGTTWTQLTFDPARAVAVNPASVTNDTVLLGVPGQGILRSTDNGTTFTRTSTGLDSTEVIKIVFQPSGGTAYAVLDCNHQDFSGPGAGNWGGLFRSTDAGVNWTNFNNGGGGSIVLNSTNPFPDEQRCVRTVAVSGSGAIFAGTLNPFNVQGRIYRSTGAGWGVPTASANVVGVESLHVDRNLNTRIYAGSRQIGSWVSTDQATWSQITNQGTDRDAFTKTYAIETIPSAPATILIAAKGVGIMRTVNSGTEWAIAPGLKADRVRGLANHTNAAPATYWMALENGAVMKSTNSGGLWSALISGFDAGIDDANVDARSIAADPNSTAAGSVLVATRPNGLYKLNAGLNGWDQGGIAVAFATNGFDNKPQAVVMPSSGLVYYTNFDATNGASWTGGLSRSSGGATALVQTPYPANVVFCDTPSTASPGALKVVQMSNSVAYLLRHDGLPYRSADNFATNTAGCINAPSVGFSRLAFFDMTEKPAATHILVGATNKGIYRSIDSGLNWARVAITGPAGMPQVFSSVAYLSNTILYGVTRAGGLYCSTDNADTWQSVSLGGLPAVSFRELRVMNGSVHILTDGGGVYNGFTTCP